MDTRKNKRNTLNRSPNLSVAVDNSVFLPPTEPHDHTDHGCSIAESRTYDSNVKDPYFFYIKCKHIFESTNHELQSIISTTVVNFSLKFRPACAPSGAQLVFFTQKTSFTRICSSNLKIRLQELGAWCLTVLKRVARETIWTDTTAHRLSRAINVILTKIDEPNTNFLVVDSSEKHRCRLACMGTHSTCIK